MDTDSCVHVNYIWPFSCLHG
uniref:Uncharacterized protein n=1 Tax=Rhizophora mucronata TaxID=61149 RepID=A0A2P2PNC1_RHIMU